MEEPGKRVFISHAQADSDRAERVQGALEAAGIPVWPVKADAAGDRPASGHVFISYVHEDSDRVDALQEALEAAGIPVWRDKDDLWPGQDWRAMIRSAITNNALVFIACFSSQSLTKKKSYQNAELTLAREQLQLRQPDDPWLIPVRFDDCNVPDLDLGAGRTLGSIHRADLFGNRYEEGMKRLVTSIRRLLIQAPPGEITGAHPAEPTPSTVPGTAAVRPPTHPQAAPAHPEQLMGAQRQAERAQEVEREALQRLDTSSDRSWVVVSLVPDLPGQLSINSPVLNTFRQRIVGQHVTVVPPLTGARFSRASVGRRRLLADGAPEGPLAKGLSLDLHTDGSGVFGMGVPNLPSQGDEPSERWIQDESLVVAVMSGLLLLAQHARDRAAAGGNALTRAQIFPISEKQPTRLAQTRHYGFIDPLGDHVLTTPPPPAEATTELDDLAQPGPKLAATTALLADDIAQEFGVPEMPQLSHDGQLRRRYWSYPQMITWAEENGIAVIDDTIT